MTTYPGDVKDTEVSQTKSAFKRTIWRYPLNDHLQKSCSSVMTTCRTLKVKIPYKTADLTLHYAKNNPHIIISIYNILIKHQFW